MTGEWKFGDPVTPAIILKRNKTRKANADRKGANSVTGHMRRMLGMGMEDWKLEVTDTVAEHVAKAGLVGLFLGERDRLGFFKELLDRTEGKTRQMVPVPKIVDGRAQVRQTIPMDDVASMEAEMRKMGLDEAADALVRETYERQQSQTDE